MVLGLKSIPSLASVYFNSVVHTDGYLILLEHRQYIVNFEIKNSYYLNIVQRDILGTVVKDILPEGSQYSSIQFVMPPISSKKTIDGYFI